MSFFFCFVFTVKSGIKTGPKNFQLQTLRVASMLREGMYKSRQEQAQQPPWCQML